MTELAAPQISSLMEALPGIAAVLRSPVASAMVSLVRAGAGLEEYRVADADELLKFGVRRNLLTQDEVDRLLEEVRAAADRKPVKPAPAPVAVKAPKVAAAPVHKPAPAAKPTKPVEAKAPAKPAPKPAAKAAPAKAKAPVKAAAKKPAPKPTAKAVKKVAKPAAKAAKKRR